MYKRALLVVAAVCVMALILRLQEMTSPQANQNANSVPQQQF